jgi:small-conductance mechanosensitive channel
MAALADDTEAAAASLRKIDADLAADPVVGATDARLATLTGEITAGLAEDANLLAPGSSLETLKALDRKWTDVRRQLLKWATDLAARGNELRRDEERLIELTRKWQGSLDAARAARAEPGVVERITGVVGQIAATHGRVAARFQEVWALQGRVAAQDVRAAGAVSAVREAQAQAVNRLLDRDSPPLWNPGVRSQAQQNLAEDTRNSFATQWTAMRAYVQREAEGLALHGGVIGALAAGIIWMRRKWADDLRRAAEPARSLAVFDMPIASAIVATVPIVPWFYPQAPRLFLAVVGGAMLVPSVLVLRQLLRRTVMPLLYGLMACYFIGLVVRVTAAMPALSRTLLAAEMAGGVVFLLWFLRFAPRQAGFDELARSGRWRLVRFVARGAAVVMGVSAAANVLGFTSLARLLGNTLLASAYTGVILLACVSVADALLAGAAHARPVAALHVIRRHGALVRRRVMGVVSLAAAAWWAWITLEMLSLRRPLLDRAGRALTAEWGYGAVSLSLGGLLAFAITIAAAILLSRLARFLLEEEVYPRVRLARGIPYAVTTLLRYIILFVGFLIAVAAMGYDITKFTILAGAFGVGLGFGMQNIVNNFVSGLILLFERPIQVGDVIELDSTTVGAVARIGIRASVVRLGSGADVIVPNGMLIANRVTNWTLTTRQRGFDIGLSLAAGAEPGRVIALLKRVAGEQERIAKAPAPQAYVAEFLSAGGLKFDLRVWTERYDDWPEVRSDLVTAIDAALTAEGIKRA